MIRIQTDQEVALDLPQRTFSGADIAVVPEQLTIHAQRAAFAQIHS